MFVLLKGGDVFRRALSSRVGSMVPSSEFCVVVVGYSFAVVVGVNRKLVVLLFVGCGVSRRVNEELRL